MEDHPDILFDRKITVNTITLDDWASGERVESVDLLWLDMQGYELPTLKASKKLLKSVKVIATEVSSKETYVGVAKFEEFDD